MSVSVSVYVETWTLKFNSHCLQRGTAYKTCVCVCAPHINGFVYRFSFINISVLMLIDLLCFFFLLRCCFSLSYTVLGNAKDTRACGSKFLFLYWHSIFKSMVLWMNFSFAWFFLRIDERVHHRLLKTSDWRYVKLNDVHDYIASSITMVSLWMSQWNVQETTYCQFQWMSVSRSQDITSTVLSTHFHFDKWTAPGEREI